VQKSTDTHCEHGLWYVVFDSKAALCAFEGNFGVKRQRWQFGSTQTRACADKKIANDKKNHQ
jgi:hypothetical protein